MDEFDPLLNIIKFPLLVICRARLPDPRTIPPREFNMHRQDFFKAWAEHMMQSSATAADALDELEFTINETRCLVLAAFPCLSGHPSVQARHKAKQAANGARRRS